MNFRLSPSHSVVLMSLRTNAPYADRIEEDGRVLIYEGHDAPRGPEVPDPKAIDQPSVWPSGRPMQNGLFFAAARSHADGGSPSERVRVYQKIRQGIWTYNGLFILAEAWMEPSGDRQVFKFRLEVADGDELPASQRHRAVEPVRLIPTAVKNEVWRRDGGRCVRCGADNDLHFDHIIPFSKGGSSITTANVQLLCARHNLQKGAGIE